MKMLQWMNRVVKLVSVRRGEPCFLAANTVTSEGVNFLVKKGGYSLAEKFDTDYPGLRKDCPTTAPATNRRTIYTYKFQM